MKSTKAVVVMLVSALAILAAVPIFAQAPAPPFFPPAQLDQMVARVALYPDSLLAQIFAAATYPDQIPDAARWADQHHYLSGQALADAIQADQLPWDPSVQALLPFPSVLDMMASDMGWTTDLGNAFLAQQQDVMDAVQRERRKAYDYGYLRTNPQVIVGGGPYITIAPVNPAFIVVPYYSPAVVFVAPRAWFRGRRRDSLRLRRGHRSLPSGRGAGAPALLDLIGAGTRFSSTTLAGDEPG